MGRGLAAAGPGAAPRAVARLEGGAWPEKVPLRLPAGLTYLAGHSPAAALLSDSSAFGATLLLAHALIA